MNHRSVCSNDGTRQVGGYTLIEVLISVAIFATLSLVAYSALDGLSKASVATDGFEKDLARLQLAIVRLDGDIQSLVARPTWGQSAADHGGEFFGRASAIGGLRSGWANPTAQPRASVQRFQWQWQNNRLERLYWSSLHTDRSDAVQVEVVLEDISAWSMQYLTHSGQWQTQWTPSAQQSLPKAVAYTFDHPRFGEIRRVLVVD